MSDGVGSRPALSLCPPSSGLPLRCPLSKQGRPAELLLPAAQRGPVLQQAAGSLTVQPFSWTDAPGEATGGLSVQLQPLAVGITSAPNADWVPTVFLSGACG